MINEALQGRVCLNSWVCGESSGGKSSSRRRQLNLQGGTVFVSAEDIKLIDGGIVYCQWTLFSCWWLYSRACCIAGSGWICQPHGFPHNEGGDDVSRLQRWRWSCSTENRVKETPESAQRGQLFLPLHSCPQEFFFLPLCSCSLEWSFLFVHVL